ncbi:hypothetical protein [Enhygromyxa salina]|uniref:Uncharacterized protein n=1 Tax=Enhygromyxa salina TaxID=215803 RepID=A0A2S9YWT5_9BACT|nr:hypothetical protein [Enhygromyxa salina]PRQ09558.1 hypothetical protein ENSA7_06130 [Enhygromyxa salina]
MFLHATLEDVVRTTLELRLPIASADQLAVLGFAVGKNIKDRISMSELAQHRGKSVDQLIIDRIEAFLERSNFNNIYDLTRALEQCALEKSLLSPHKNNLAAMMSRRHWIVHRADRHEHRQDLDERSRAVLYCDP